MVTRRTVFISDLVLDAYIGAYDSEQGITQPITINLEVDVTEPEVPDSEKLEDVVCYNKLTQSIKAIIAEGHIRLVETLAERIAALALAHPMVQHVSVSVDKPHAIAEAKTAGVRLSKSKS